MQNIPPRLIDLQTAADLVGVSIRTVVRWVESGLIPEFRVDKHFSQPVRYTDRLAVVAHARSRKRR
jgi:hypothetical protein